MVAIDSEGSQPRAVHLEPTRGETVLLDRSVAVVGGGYRLLASSIEAPGAYDLSVETDNGVPASTTYAIEDRDIRAVSNLLVWPDSEDVTFGTEE